MFPDSQPPNLHAQLKRLKANHAAIQRDYDHFVAKLKQELEFAESKNFTQEAIDRLKAEIKAAKKIYSPDLDRLDAEIGLLEKAIAAEEKESNALAEQRAAQEESELRESLYAAWLESGGRPSEFAEVWPELKKAEMIKRTQSVMATQSSSIFQVGLDA